MNEDVIKGYNQTLFRSAEFSFTISIWICSQLRRQDHTLAMKSLCASSFLNGLRKTTFISKWDRVHIRSFIKLQDNPALDKFNKNERILQESSGDRMRIARGRLDFLQTHISSLPTSKNSTEEEDVLDSIIIQTLIQKVAQEKAKIAKLEAILFNTPDGDPDFFVGEKELSKTK
ncbi:hypothetical protein RvY_00620-2 [Ramazzottius varieornatus]|nr:hypothetical protein RvY_00620-2 [Ramazzottius varieornatus]